MMGSLLYPPNIIFSISSSTYAGTEIKVTSGGISSEDDMTTYIGGKCSCIFANPQEIKGDNIIVQ